MLFYEKRFKTITKDRKLKNEAVNCWFCIIYIRTHLYSKSKDLWQSKAKKAKKAKKTKLSTYVKTFTHNKKPKHVYKLVENAEFLCLACLAAWMEFQSSHTSTRFEVVTILGLESFICSNIPNQKQILATFS